MAKDSYKLAILTIERKFKIIEATTINALNGDFFHIECKHSEPFLIFDVIYPPADYQTQPPHRIIGLTDVEIELFKRDIFLFKYLENDLFHPAETPRELTTRYLT